MTSSEVFVGSEESSQSNKDVHSDIQTDPTAAWGEREFVLRRTIPGHDTLNTSYYILNDTLCDLCSSYIASCLGKQHQGHGKSVPVSKHYSSLRALKISARTGCELCFKILESSSLVEYDRMGLVQSNRSRDGVSCYNDGHVFIPTYHFEGLRNDRFAFRIYPLGKLFQGRSKDKDIEFEFMLAKDESDCLVIPYLDYRDVLRFPSLSPTSQESFDQIRHWHDNCIKEHIKCPRQDLPLPRRLLDVLARTDDGTDGVTLVETGGLSKLPNNTRYVALSYCWGGWTGLITKKENLESMMRNISLEELPAVVKDAIYVCRRYGVQYLWVDAFCICQDDAVEWQNEAVNMANVYGGCEFVISVLTSSKANEGFLKERNFKPVSLGSVKVSYGTWCDSVTLFIRRIPRSLDEEFEHSPLNRRAWLLQEKILGPAVLHYGRDQLIWECNTGHLCSETRETSAVSPTVIRISDILGTESSVGISDLWDSILEEFTSRHLTYRKDRLPALSGIASKLRKYGACTGRFVAGMWETGLEFQLMWYTVDITRTNSFSSVQPNSRIPTWSWAHRDVPITPSLVRHCCSSLLESAKFLFEDSEEERKSHSEYVVENCSIILRGFIQKFSYKAISMDSQHVKYQTGNWMFLGLPGSDSRWWFD